MPQTASFRSESLRSDIVVNVVLLRENSPKPFSLSI